MAAQRPVACRLMSEYHIIKTCSDLREFRLCVPSTIFEELQPPSLISETSGNVHSCNVFERSPTLPGSQLNLVSTSRELCHFLSSMVAYGLVHHPRAYSNPASLNSSLSPMTLRFEKRKPECQEYFAAYNQSRLNARTEPQLTFHTSTPRP